MYRFANNETQLVPILHNGRLPKMGAICPPEIQLVLVEMGIMDVQFRKMTIVGNGIRVERRGV